MDETQVWTDGSFSEKTGHGGWAWVSHTRSDSGGTDSGHSSGAMEHRAIIYALRAHPVDEPLVIFTDHLHFARTLRAERDLLHLWLAGPLRRRGTMSHGLMVLAYEELSGRTVRFEHVRSHAGETHNERADRLAKAARIQSESEGESSGHQDTGMAGA